MAVDKIGFSIKPKFLRLLDELATTSSRTRSGQIEYLVRLECDRLGVRVEGDETWHVDWFNRSGLRVGTKAFADRDEAEALALELMSQVKYSVVVTPPGVK